MSHVIRCTLVAVLVAALAPASSAAEGDLYARGVRSCTSTYSPGHDTPRRFGPPLDINAAGGDRGRPVLAPTDGTVEVFSRGGIYGLSVVWRSIDGVEAIHVAHLERIVRRGEVEAGEIIGRAGSTGHSFGEGHLHIARQLHGRPATMELSGRRLGAFECYVSRGPVRQRCLGLGATIVGTAGRDRLTGTSGTDVIVSRGGDDVIDAGRGDDVICGGNGNDRVGGGPGNDRVSAGPGDDRLAGSDGDDALTGDDGADSADGGAGTDACDAEQVVECEPPPPVLAARLPLG